jgi:hypothetical protein
MSRPPFRALVAAGVSSLPLTSLAKANTTAATTTTDPQPGAVEIVPPDESFGGATLGQCRSSLWLSPKRPRRPQTARRSPPIDNEVTTARHEARHLNPQVSKLEERDNQ